MLPMFFDDAHRVLGAELGEALEGHDPELHVPKRIGGRLAELELFKLLVPASMGGRAVGSNASSVDVRALCIAREALAYVSPVADSVFAVQGLGSHPVLLAAGGFPRRGEFLHEVMTGDRIGAFALTEPDAGTDVASMKTRARRDGSGWLLTGEKCFISNVGIADHFIVFANAVVGEEGTSKKTISAFLLDANAKGLTLTPQRAGGDHPLGKLSMRDCRVPADALLGEVGHGLRLALGTLDVFRTSVGAAAVGMARRALDETVARVTSRTQFGQRIADFQLTQAALADMATELDAARLLVYRSAWAKDHGERAASEVAMAKMFATEAAQRIIDRAVQLHGGSGVLEGSVIEQLYRDIRPLRIYEGTTEIQKLIIGAALVAAPNASTSRP